MRWRISSPVGVLRLRQWSGVGTSLQASSYDDSPSRSTRLKDDQDETLTLVEAALESSYSTEHLRKMVASGTIPNAGGKGRPRIRRGDVPFKRVTKPGNPGTPEDDARAFLNRTKDERR